MRFVEFIEEEDGSTTLVAEDDGKMHEFRGLAINVVRNDSMTMPCGAVVTSIPLGEWVSVPDKTRTEKPKMTTAIERKTEKKMNKAEQHQMELAGELGRAAAITRQIIGEGQTITPFMLADMLTSIPEEDDSEDEKEFITSLKAELPKAHELVTKIFGELPHSTLEAALAVALRTPEDADEEDLEVFVEDFGFAVEAIKTECGTVDVASACLFFDELNQ